LLGGGAPGMGMLGWEVEEEEKEVAVVVNYGH
jgi:hypothetical protein